MTQRLPRRTMLRGMGLGGIAIGLPVLDAMLNDNGHLVNRAGAEVQTPLSFLTFFLPCGVHVEDWWPHDEGPNYDVTRCLAPIGHLKSEFNLLQHLSKDEAFRNQDINNDAHDRGHASFATGGSLAGRSTVEFASADQIAAQALGGDTKFRSLPVALTGIGGRSQANYISWTSGTSPVPPDNDPVVLFDRLFGDSLTEANSANPLAPYRKSILDYVGQEITDLNKRLGSDDRNTVGQYLNSVREIERQLEPSRLQVSCEAPERVNPSLGGRLPASDRGDGQYSNERAKALIWLQVTAVACGLTRFGSFMLSNRQNKRQFTWLGIPEDGDGHHGISHDSSPTGLERQSLIVIDEMQQFAYMLDLMQAAKQGERTLLYNSIVFFANEHGHGEGHDFQNVPVIIAGRAGGQLKPGNHIVYPRLTPYSNVFVSILQLLGMDVQTFGAYGTAPLSRLLA